MPDAPTPRPTRSAPDSVWAAVRADYLSGMPAAEACRRHRVGRSTLRDRAAREGWRRADQPWPPPGRLDPDDEGAALSDSVGGDVARLSNEQLRDLAGRRMIRAILRGDAMESLRWRRVRAALHAEIGEAEARRIFNERLAMNAAFRARNQ
ncbi:hypothetical protein BrevBR_05595 [Brevundimonas sp. BR2-1]|uniref:hypothetical protein n=1 Tax=Brevundimonas sp. BR2-1 TaxID=3031123 RepID=UPI0030A571BB